MASTVFASSLRGLWYNYVLISVFLTAFSGLCIASTNSTSSGNVAEAALIFPREGDRFSTNDLGMAAVVAVQNVEEAWKHKWFFTWMMCTNQTDRPGFRWCEFSGDGDSYSGNDPVVLQESGPYIGLSHSYWYKGSKTPVIVHPGVYLFEWAFSIGPWCAFGEDPWFESYAYQKQISSGSFNVTVAEDAPLPALKTDACASFAGAVSYVAVATYNFGHSVDNDPACVQTAPVTNSPDPCGATLNAAQATSASGVMGWSATPTSSLPTATSTSPDTSTSTNAESSGISLTECFLDGWVVSLMIMISWTINIGL